MTEEQECYIYKITCLPEQKSYVGQTQKYKYKDEKPYRYGIAGRWCDHVSSARSSETPFHKSIREHGAENFIYEMIERVDDVDADERETHWIRELNTLAPKGYNVMSHSRCKHRQGTTVADIYLRSATAIELKTICRDGSPRLVYVYVTTPTEMKRFTFGQSLSASYEEALAEANAMLDKFREAGVTVKDSNKRSPFENQQLKKIRLALFNKTMVAVYITTNSGQQRICFGSKKIPYEKALEKARLFIDELQTDVLEDNL
jgi:group I intron endonuclease